MLEISVFIILQLIFVSFKKIVNDVNILYFEGFCIVKMFCAAKVVANAVAAISEIMETSPTASQIVDLNTQIINKLLTALNECTE